MLNSANNPWLEKSYVDGVHTVEVNDFDSFCAFVNRGFGDTDTDYIWRGQRDARWEIVSSLNRTGKKNPSLLTRFRDAVARCTNIEYDIEQSGDEMNDNRLRLWSLGQHHGLCTPLIDWTTYPYIALFFAFAEPSQQVAPRCVYALSWFAVKLINGMIMQKYEDFRRQLINPPYNNQLISFLVESYGKYYGNYVSMIHEASLPEEEKKKLCSWEYLKAMKRQLRMFNPSTNENPRIHAQGGNHVFTPNDTSIENWIKDSRATTGYQGAVLTKIIMPNERRDDILKSLNKMNINYLSIFPDYHGAALYCNMTLDKPDRLGLRAY